MIKKDVGYKVEGYNFTWHEIDRELGHVLLSCDNPGVPDLVVEENAEVVDEAYQNIEGDECVLPTITKKNEIIETHEPLGKDPDEGSLSD